MKLDLSRIPRSYHSYHLDELHDALNVVEADRRAAMTREEIERYRQTIRKCAPPHGTMIVHEAEDVRIAREIVEKASRDKADEFARLALERKGSWADRSFPR